MTRKTTLITLLALVTCAMPACTSMYYETMEVFGRHKRDLLVSRVVDARDEQAEAKEQFQSALEKFSALVDAPYSELRRTYDELNGELERSEAKAEDVRERIESIQTVGDDLFREWESELDQYSSDELRRTSRDTMDRTRARYDEMMRAMRRPEQKMNEVLVSFRDHVLFLKHNLNAQTVASLQGTVDSLGLETAQLVREMEEAIAEADAFIESMNVT